MDVKVGDRVRVYRNLHKKMFSVQMHLPTAKWLKSHGQLRWKVVDHVERIALLDPVFKVSEAGRQRVLRERRKNVHAFVEGDVITADYADADYNNWVTVSYNPYKAPTFVAGASGPIFTASIAIIDDGKIWVVR